MDLRGSYTVLHVDLAAESRDVGGGDQRVQVRARRGHQYGLDMPIHFGLNAEMVRFFDPENVAFVFRQYSLYPTMSLYDDLAFPPRFPLRRTPEPQIKQRVAEIAAVLPRHGRCAKQALVGGALRQRDSTIGRLV